MSLLKNEKGFTLLEMMLVLFVLSVLLIIGIPSITSQKDMISKKGCDALVRTAQAQVEAYELENGKIPTSLTELVSENYIGGDTCPNGKKLEYAIDGTVSASE